MTPTKFLIGMTSGAVLALLVAGALLLGLGQIATSAQSATPTASSAAPTATPVKQGSETGTPVSIAKGALEQRLLQPISDAEWTAAASTLGITVDDLNSQLKDGHSVDELGSAKGVTVQQIKDAMIAAGQSAVAGAVQAGTITQADADRLNQGLVLAIADKVTRANTQSDGTPGPTSDQIKDATAKKSAAGQNEQVADTVTMAELSAAAQTLGVTNDQLKESLGSDNGLSSYPSVQNVTEQQVKDAMIAAGQAALDQAVQSGTLSHADADQAGKDIVQLFAEKITDGLFGSGQATPTP